MEIDGFPAEPCRVPGVRYDPARSDTVTIGVLARHAGVRPSAIRYYERLGVMPAPPRRSGRRDYDSGAIAQLAVVQFALAAGFSLRDAKRLMREFSRTTPAHSRWRELAEDRIKELDQVIARATARKGLLQRITTNCHCNTLTDCGRALAQNRARWFVEGDRRIRPPQWP